MRSVARNFRRTLAAIAIASPILAGTAMAQDAPPFRVLIDGTAIGSATAAANLPTDAVVLHQSADTTLPRTQVAAGQQSSVILTTTDPILVGAMRTWMSANNSGSKNTVQPKTVEIDRIDGATTTRYRLLNAWPSKLEPGATTAITIVYQQLEKAS